MPNHCENDLVIKGSKEALEKVVNECFTPTEDGTMCLNFDKIIPYPAKFGTADEKADKLRKEWEAKPHAERGPYPMVKDGFNSGGHEWCIKNWGTKWNAYSVNEFEKTDDIVKVSFSTAWTAPHPVMAALSKKFPELSINLKTYERGMEWQCEIEFKKGKIVAQHEDKYDGPRGG